MKTKTTYKRLKDYILLILILFIALISINKATAQNYELKGDTYELKQEPKKAIKSNKTGLKVEINGIKYDLLQGAKGGHFIWRTSKKTGKKYKQYIKIE